MAGTLISGVVVQGIPEQGGTGGGFYYQFLPPPGISQWELEAVHWFGSLCTSGPGIPFRAP